MSTLPSFFVSHGSPMLALDAGSAGATWQAAIADLPKPKAILMVSAHWAGRAPTLSLAAQPQTIHDFGGFPPALYQLQYPAPGAPELAQQAANLLSQAGFAPQLHPDRGLDHGAWVPLRVMYPEAQIPVTQLSVQVRESPQCHYQLGQTLAPLREEGILIVASGSLTHNLYEIMPDISHGDPRIPSYVPAFQAWIHDQIAQHHLEALFNYRQQAPAAVRAHPSDEHLLPLFVAMGAGGGQSQRLHAEIELGVLAMDVWRFD